jgi:hypothetical protein
MRKSFPSFFIGESCAGEARECKLQECSGVPFNRAIATLAPQNIQKLKQSFRVLSSPHTRVPYHLDLFSFAAPSAAARVPLSLDTAKPAGHLSGGDIVVHVLFAPLARSGLFGMAIQVKIALASSQTRSKLGGWPWLSENAVRPGSEAVTVPSTRFPPALLKTAFLVFTSKVKKYGIWFLSSIHRRVTGSANTGRPDAYIARSIRQRRSIVTTPGAEVVQHEPTAYADSMQDWVKDD